MQWRLTELKSLLSADEIIFNSRHNAHLSCHVVLSKSLLLWFVLAENEAILVHCVISWNFDNKIIKMCVHMQHTHHWSQMIFSLFADVYTAQIHDNLSPRGQQPTCWVIAVTRWNGAVGIHICTWDQITEVICTTPMLACSQACSGPIYLQLSRTACSVVWRLTHGRNVLCCACSLCGFIFVPPTITVLFAVSMWADSEHVSRKSRFSKQYTRF